MSLSGIDVSSWNGGVHWPDVAASGRAFAFSKATESVDYLNPTFADNWRGIAAAGLVRGAYHYARPSRNAPEAEAEYFVSALETAGGLEAGDLLALDLEDPNGAPGAPLLDWTLRWLRAVEEATGVRPILYSGYWYLSIHDLTGHDDLAASPIWLAAYQDDAPAPPPPWPALDFWQHTDAQSVPGVNGNVDGDLFFGTLEELRALGKGTKPSRVEEITNAVQVLRGWSRQSAQMAKELSDVADIIERLG